MGKDRQNFRELDWRTISSGIFQWHQSRPINMYFPIKDPLGCVIRWTSEQ